MESGAGRNMLLCTRLHHMADDPSHSVHSFGSLSLSHRREGRELIPSEQLNLQHSMVVK